MSARNERAKDVAIVGAMVACWAVIAAAIIGGVITGHYEPLIALPIAAAILAFVWWVSSDD